MTTILIDDPNDWSPVPAPVTGDLFSVVRTSLGQKLANRTAWLKNLATVLGVPKIRFGAVATMIALTGNAVGDAFLVTSSGAGGGGLYYFDTAAPSGGYAALVAPYIIPATGGGYWYREDAKLLGTYVPYAPAGDGRVPSSQLQVCTTDVDLLNRIGLGQVPNGITNAVAFNFPSTILTTTSTSGGSSVFTGFFGNQLLASDICEFSYCFQAWVDAGVGIIYAALSVGTTYIFPLCQVTGTTAGNYVGGTLPFQLPADGGLGGGTVFIFAQAPAGTTHQITIGAQAFTGTILGASVVAQPSAFSFKSYRP